MFSKVARVAKGSLVRMAVSLKIGFHDLYLFNHDVNIRCGTNFIFPVRGGMTLAVERCVKLITNKQNLISAHLFILKTGMNS